VLLLLLLLLLLLPLLYIMHLHLLHFIANTASLHFTQQLQVPRAGGVGAGRAGPGA
jgi:hypothetical protein